VQRAELQAEDHRRLELLVQGLEASRQALTQQLQRQAQAGSSPQAANLSSPRTPRNPGVPSLGSQSLQSMAGGHDGHRLAPGAVLLQLPCQHYKHGAWVHSIPLPRCKCKVQNASTA
jgi:hypothetical protein